MARFIEVAPGLHRLPLMPMDGINVYLLGDVLVDAGTHGAARKLAALEPDIVCFGHGPPLRDAERFQDVVRALPA